MLSLRGVYVCTNAAADSGQNTHANARKRLRPPSDATLKRQWHQYQYALDTERLHGAQEHRPVVHNTGTGHSAAVTVQTVVLGTVKSRSRPEGTYLQEKTLVRRLEPLKEPKVSGYLKSLNAKRRLMTL